MQTLATAHSNDTKDQVDAPTATESSAQPLNEGDARAPSLIFVTCLIERQAARDTLDAYRDKLIDQQRKRFSGAKAKLIDALWKGIWQLQLECECCAKEARERGQLLLAWEGTTALKGVTA